jgi:membrane protein implicated in regulation of membrane protease activity
MKGKHVLAALLLALSLASLTLYLIVAGAAALSAWWSGMSPAMQRWVGGGLPLFSGLFAVIGAAWRWQRNRSTDEELHA